MCGLLSATARLTNLNGGYVSNTDGRIGYHSGAIGAVTVDGSQWTNSGFLYVGSGTLGIKGRGSVLSASGTVGGHGVGVVTLNGTGSLWNNSGELDVGGNGGEGDSGTLHIHDGGVVSNTVGYVGKETSGQGTGNVTVVGAGSAVEELWRLDSGCLWLPAGWKCVWWCCVEYRGPYWRRSRR